MNKRSEQMNEILFQGKRTDNGEWVQGDFCKPCNIVYEEIGYDECTKQDNVPIWNDCAVTPETVSRYSGFGATNGRIFENHIIRCGEYYFVVTYGRCGKSDGGYEGFYLQGYDERTKKAMSRGLRDDIHYWINEYGAEIIGNVFDAEVQE